MSLVVNTNMAATMASNNLTQANAALQKSLTRLSSGSKIVSPADDAGGLAVSLKLSAAAKRQGAAKSNLANALSYLQTQDGALRTAAKVLDRISELKTYANDPTKNASDIGNYNIEFLALQQELNAIGGETLNGVSLFSSSSISVKTSDEGGTTSTMDMAGVNLLGTGGTAPAWTDVSGVTAGWVSSNPLNTYHPGALYIGGGCFGLDNAGTFSTSQTNVSGPYTLSFSFLNSSGADFSVSGGGSGSVTLSEALYSGFADHTFTISVDASGNGIYSVDGAAGVAVSNFAPGGGGAITFTHGSGSNNIYNDLSLTSAASGSGNVATVASAASLSVLTLDSVKSALQDVATYRAQNGANQSRINTSVELLTQNKANLEAANSRLVDVDVAEESTVLARTNVLVQAGTQMLAQANQANRNALKLIT